MTTKYWPLLCLLFLFSCDDKQDLTTGVDQSGSVETGISVQHADSTHDVILTTHKIWIAYKQYQTIVHRDTVPALGSTTEEAANGSGDTKNVQLQKDYQIFITVK